MKQLLAKRAFRYGLPLTIYNRTPLTEAELEAIWAAAAALPPPQRAAFQEMVTPHLASLPCAAVGPGSLHRIIAACQHAILKSGAVAVGPSPKHGQVRWDCWQGQGQVSRSLAWSMALNYQIAPSKFLPSSDASIPGLPTSKEPAMAQAAITPRMRTVVQRKGRWRGALTPSKAPAETLMVMLMQASITIAAK